jgi:RNA polymerase sigma-70 factor, ECF subfamily
MVALEVEVRIRFREGDMEALSLIVERYQGVLYRLGLRLLGRAEDAKDLAQDAFLRAFEKRETYDCQRPFEPWIYRVTVNLARERQRRKKEYLSGDDLPEQAAEAVADQELVKQERRHLVVQALQRIGAKYREVLGLRFESDFSLAEIGEALGISLGTVKSRLSRGLQAFHKSYVAVGGDSHDLP